MRLWFAKPELAIVPNVVGATQESAAKQLQRARLQPIPAGADKSTKPPGTVTRTSPLPGTTVVVNSEAIYWIAEPAPEAVPNVVGLSEKIAVQRLQQTPLRPNSRERMNQKIRREL